MIILTTEDSECEEGTEVRLACGNRVVDGL